MPSQQIVVPADLPREVPAFRELNERQQRFVLALLQFGSGKGKRALCARAAGYEGDDQYVRVQAHRLYHNPAVKKALQEVARAELMSLSLFAVEGIAKLAEDSTDEKVKLKALIELANRTGFAVEQVINVKHEDVNRTEDQTLENMVTICLRKPHMIDMIPEPRRSLVQAKLEERQGKTKVAPLIELTAERDPDADLLGE